MVEVAERKWDAAAARYDLFSRGPERRWGPVKREIFSAMEKLCYGKERWDDAMALYNEVIAHVEKGETRAYRLGDLYSRRGQVQRQFMKEPTLAATSFLRVIGRALFSISSKPFGHTARACSYSTPESGTGVYM